MKIIIKVLRAVLITALCLILLINLYMLFERVALHKDLPTVCGYSQAVVMSGSMEPVFSVGDMLIFKQQSEYAVGDVVIFRQDGAFVTHRIVQKTAEGFVTKGDANNTEDRQALDPALIEGKMIGIVPGVGGVLTFLKTPFGILLLLLVAILLVEGPHVAAALKKRKEEPTT